MEQWNDWQYIGTSLFDSATRIRKKEVEKKSSIKRKKTALKWKKSRIEKEKNREVSEKEKK